MSAEEAIVVLYASATAIAQMRVDADSLFDLLHKSGVPVVRVDGASPENKDLRTKLFEVSGHRGKYPQLFRVALNPDRAVTRVEEFIIPTTDDTYTFLGLYDDLHTMNERDADTGGFQALFTGIPRFPPTQLATFMVLSPTSGMRTGPDPVPAYPTITSRGASSAAAPTAPAPKAAPSATIAAPVTPSSLEQSPPAGASAPPAHGGARASVAAPATAKEWKKVEDSSTGEFYWNEKEGKPSWVDPSNAVAAAGSAEPVWVPRTSSSGRTYYYNFATGESRWLL